MSETHERHFKGVWIPKEIWDSTKLSWMEKCLLAEINCLDDEKTGCTASNAYLARKFNTTAQTIVNALSRIRAVGLLETIAFDGRKRAMQIKSMASFSFGQGKQKSLGRMNPDVYPETAPIILENKAKCTIKNKDSEKGKPDESQPTPQPELTLTSEPEPESAFQELKALFLSAHLKWFKHEYLFQDGRDGKAIKALLRTGKTPKQIMGILELAWERKFSWNCVHRSKTINGAADSWNNIIHELQLPDLAPGEWVDEDGITRSKANPAMRLG